MNQNKNFTKKKRSRNHNNLSIDNIIKKVKGKIMKCIYDTCNKIFERDNKNVYLDSINKKYVENVTKVFNIKFLQEKIYSILSLNPHNMTIIQQYCLNEQLQEIMNMTLNSSIQKLFLMKSKEFEEKYSFKNQFLFENLKEIPQVYKKMEKTLKKENSLLTYFEELKGRKRKKEDFYYGYDKSIQEIKENYKTDSIQNDSTFKTSNNFNQIEDEMKNDFYEIDFSDFDFQFNTLFNI